MIAHITRLELKNWRNFRHVDVPLGGRTFVVGPNASGKSNLLDALRFLRDIAAPGGSLIAAVSERRGLKHIRSLHATGTNSVTVEVSVVVDRDPDPWSYMLELSGSDTVRNPLRINREVVKHGNATILSRPRREDSDERLLTETHLEQISQSLKFRPLADALASIDQVHVVPQVARMPARAEEFSKREAPGSDFIEQLARLSERQQERVMRRIEKLLRIAVPRFSELKVSRDEIGRPHLEAKYAHWRPRGGWQNEQEFSDGTLRLIGLLWAIDNGTTPLLLEEPELSLHRDVIRQIPRLITSAARRSGRQVVVSTHAEEMLSDRGIDPREILLLEPTEYETKVVLGDSRPEIVAAAEAKIPLGRIVTALTKPRDIEQLAIALPTSNGR